MTFPAKIPLEDRPEWATLCPSRKPQFKVHSNRGLAFSAFSDKRPRASVAIYHLENSEWVLFLSYDKDSPCSQCGHPLDRMRGGYVADTGLKNRWEEGVICSDCHLRERQRKKALQEEEKDRKEYERLKGIFG